MRENHKILIYEACINLKIIDLNKLIYILKQEFKLIFSLFHFRFLFCRIFLGICFIQAIISFSIKFFRLKN